MKKVLITGSSSGLGQALCKKFTSLNWTTIGISKSNSENVTKSIIADFKDHQNLNNKLFDNKSDLKNLDLVILNAGQLGRIDRAENITLSELNEIIAINVLSNKLIIDFLKSQKKAIDFIAISSGASLKPYSGWLQYCISKSALNQLIACCSPYENVFLIRSHRSAGSFMLKVWTFKAGTKKLIRLFLSKVTAL